MSSAVQTVEQQLQLSCVFQIEYINVVCHNSCHQPISHQSVTATLVEAMLICYTMDCTLGVPCNTETITPLTHQRPGLHCSS